ncbi:MAG: glycosyltransferase family 39 protein [Stellaceae bacterium]
MSSEEQASTREERSAEPGRGTGSALPGWRVPGLAAILLLGAGLRGWGIERNGFGTEYYAAGVRSMAGSWHNFLFNAFDPAGFVSLDKPPLAFWLQVASVKLLGFSGFALHLPQLLEGVGAIALLYHLVARRFGATAGLLAALFLALTPISVAVDRSDNTDSCLVLFLLLASWPLIVAAERASTGLLLLAAALVGLAFNAKMLAALVVVPGFLAIYLCAAPVAWKRRLIDAALAGAVLAAVSLSWIALYDLTPAASRPYAGSSHANSMLELAVGHNGIERLIRRDRPPAPLPVAAAAPARRFEPRTPPGPLRLLHPALVGQVAWLLPLALAGMLLPLRRQRSLLSLPPRPLAALLWSGWALIYGAVLSFAAGLFHDYYLVTLAPPLATLAAIAVVELWSRAPEGGGRRLLPAMLLLTAAWQAAMEWRYVPWQLGDWRLWLLLALAGGSGLAAAGLLTAPRDAMARRGAALGLGIAALLATPTAWALSNVLERGNVAFPVADLSLLATGEEHGRDRFAGEARLARDETLLGFLLRHRTGERYLLAVPNARLAAPIILRSGEPVMALGGFSGGDPILDPAALARLVEAGELRFILIGGPASFGRGAEAEARGRAFADWIASNGAPIDPALWRASVPEPPAGGRGTGRAQVQDMQLYDLRPAAVSETPRMP